MSSSDRSNLARWTQRLNGHWINWLAVVVCLLLLLPPPVTAAPTDSASIQTLPPNETPTAPTVFINELLPNPTSGTEWVELRSIGQASRSVYLPLVLNSASTAVPALGQGAAPAQVQLPVSIQGWEIGSEGGAFFVIPNQLPPVPAGAFVLIYFDGTGPAGDDYDFGDNVAVLHTPPGLTNVFGDDQGQAALYAGSTHTAQTIRSFVAWGNAPPGAAAANAEEAGLWEPNWYVPPASNGGDEIAYPTAGLSFGVVPNGDPTDVAAWAAYGPEESTPGAPNAVPSPKWAPTDDNVQMDVREFAIGWESVPGADHYQFQMDDDPNFVSPAVNVTTPQSSYVPPTNSQATQVVTTAAEDVPDQLVPDELAPGLYYWRSRAVTNRVASLWGPVRLVDLVAVSLCTEVTLGMPWKLQHSDTAMLQLDGAPETGKWAWDAPNRENGQPVRGDAQGDNYCVRASVAMVNAYYGGALSQDRISHYVLEEWAGNTHGDANDGMPENDLGWGRGMYYPDEEDEAFSWALGTTITAIGGKPSFNQFKQWIDQGRGIMMRNPGHMMAVEGYRVCADGRQQLHINDPWDAPRWQDYATQNMDGVWPGPAGVGGAPGVRSDEATIWQDTDGDGMIDFDESARFGTGVLDADTDNDLVLDKTDLREYVFNNAGNYSKRNPNLDGDALRKERDADNDNDGSLDGCEDANRNGKYEAVLGESNNFSALSSHACIGPQLYVNWKVMNYDIFIQQRNFQISNNGTGTLNWSIDSGNFPAWLSLVGSNSGSLGAGAQTTVLVNVNRAGLPVGDYTHTINVTSNGGSASITVVMKVAATATFGPPDYDSGWVSVAPDQALTLRHGLGGNPESYLVRMEYRTPDVNGINVRYFGGADFGVNPAPGHLANDRVGAYWRTLDGASITVYRRPEDDYAPQLRIRIWRGPAPHYDSGWVGVGLDRARQLVHELAGRAEHYLVDLEYKATDVNGINNRYFGGADFGNKPAPGHLENDRVGGYWRSFDGRSIWLYRRPEDSYAAQMRVRLWRMATPAYDSGWVSLAQDEARALVHNLGGDAESYLVDMLYNEGAGSFDGVNARYFGGMDIGTKPSGGVNADDRVGAYWRTLTAGDVTVYRRPQDIYAPQVRLRIWRP